MSRVEEGLSEVVITDSRLSSDHFILEGIDTSEKPIYNITEVAKFFFARTPHWLRWVDREDFLYLDGEYVGGFRHDGTSGGRRRYTLNHVEKMAHALASRNVINSAQLTNALLMVKIQAEVWGHLGAGQ